MLPIEILIADDNSIFRNGLFNVLQGESGILVSALATNGKELVDLTEIHKPHVVLTDIEMPHMNGIEATSIISQRFPGINIIALSMYNDESVIRKMFSVGAKGYLLKNSDKEEIVRAIKTVKNETIYCNSVIAKLFNYSNDSSPASVFHHTFSEKELTVMKLLCHEYSSKEIACQLNCTVRAIEHTKERIQFKIGAKNMVGIALYAIKRMIVLLNEV